MTAPWIFLPADKTVFKSLAEIQRNSELWIAKAELDRKGKY